MRLRLVAGKATALSTLFSLALIGTLLVSSSATAAESAGAPPAATELSGEEIYDRVLGNRFESYKQAITMLSGDQGSNTQSVQMNIKYMSFREESEKILSKTIARYEMPQDVRHMGYLVINKLKGADDQFIYRPTSRRVRRVNLRGEAVFGTDFSFEDIIPQELEDASYKRLDDTSIEGRDCYQVEVTPSPDADSEYSRFLTWVDKESFVPLKKIYWDDKEVQIKELNTDASSITLYQDVEKGEPKKVWMPTRSRIRNLKLGSYTNLEITSLEANPGLKKKEFSQRELAKSH